MRKIVFTNDKGQVCVVHPILNSREVPGFTEADAEERAFSAIPKSGTGARYVDESEIPTDRTFRNALKADLSFDLDKAKTIVKDNAKKDKSGLSEASIDAAKNTDELKAVIAAKK